MYWTTPRSPEDFSWVRPVASVSAAGRHIFGRRQKWLKRSREKNTRKKAFRVVHYKDFTEPETAHKKSLGVQGNWTAVLEKIYWRCVLPMEHKLRQNRELKIIEEKAINFHSTIKFTSIHRWDVRMEITFFGHKNVQWGEIQQGTRRANTL